MSTRQMLATAVLKNSGGLYSALSGLPSRKGQASHLQKHRVLFHTQSSTFGLVFPSVWSRFLLTQGPIVFNAQSISIIKYMFIHSQTFICLRKPLKRKDKGQFKQMKNIFEDLMTPPCHSWWALEGQIQLLLIQSAKLSAEDLQGNTQQTYTPLQRRAFSRWGRPSSFSALLSFFGLRRSGLSGSWPRTLFWSQTSSAVGSSCRRCISPSDIQRSSISDGYSAGLFIGTWPGPPARTKSPSPKPIVNKGHSVCHFFVGWRLKMRTWINLRVLYKWFKVEMAKKAVP